MSPRDSSDTDYIRKSERFVEVPRNENVGKLWLSSSSSLCLESEGDQLEWFKVNVTSLSGLRWRCELEWFTV